MPRAFGIEVEFSGSRGDAVAAIRAIDRPGTRNCREVSYSQWDRDAWTVATDSSVNSGGELKSRVLDFDDPEDRAEMTEVIKAMQEAGCRTDPSAGIHIHIAAENLTAEELAAVCRSYIRYEDILWRLASSGWQKIRPKALVQYAKPLEESSVKRLIKAKSRDRLHHAWYRDPRTLGSRFHAINLDAYFRKGTIEFRMFNTSMNPKRIQAYVALCIALVQDAKNGYKRALGKKVTLGTMASGPEGLAQGEKTYKWMRDIMVGVAGMSREDAKLLDYCWKDSHPQTRPASRIW